MTTLTNDFPRAEPLDIARIISGTTLHSRPANAARRHDVCAQRVSHGGNPFSLSGFPLRAGHAASDRPSSTQAEAATLSEPHGVPTPPTNGHASLAAADAVFLPGSSEGGGIFPNIQSGD